MFQKGQFRVRVGKTVFQGNLNSGKDTIKEFTKVSPPETPHVSKSPKVLKHLKKHKLIYGGGAGAALLASGMYYAKKKSVSKPPVKKIPKRR